MLQNKSYGIDCVIVVISLALDSLDRLASNMDIWVMLLTYIDSG